MVFEVRDSQAELRNGTLCARLHEHPRSCRRGWRRCTYREMGLRCAGENERRTVPSQPIHHVRLPGLRVPRQHFPPQTRDFHSRRHNPVSMRICGVWLRPKTYYALRPSRPVAGGSAQQALMPGPRRARTEGQLNWELRNLDARLDRWCLD